MNAMRAKNKPPKSGGRPWYAILYVQVLIAIFIGVLIGHFYPQTGVALKPLGDGFIALIKMMIAPVIFCTVVHGIASIGDMRKIGRVGLKTLVYFEVVSTFALILGLIVGEVFHPGAGFNINPAALDQGAVGRFVPERAAELHAVLFGEPLDLASIDLVDMHEAFAAQVLSVLKMLASQDTFGPIVPLLVGNRSLFCHDRLRAVRRPAGAGYFLAWWRCTLMGVQSPSKQPRGAQGSR